MKIKLFALFLIIFLSSCVTNGKYMTAKTVETHGTKIYNSSYENVWNAVKGTLATNGYDIAYEDPEKGIINTKQKIINMYGANGQVTAYYRQYLVSISVISDNQIKVVLSPKLFEGNNDITGRKVWVMSGPNGEITLWNKFFKDVSNLL